MTIVDCLLFVIRCWFMDVGCLLGGCSSYCVMILDCLLFGLLLVGCCLCVVGCFFVVIV